jgi:outer membrane biogenesis lipoprotein LolB
MKTQIVVSLLAAALLAGCGLAETGATAVAEADAAAEQAKQGKALEEKVKRDIEAAQQAQADAIEKAEKASQ